MPTLKPSTNNSKRTIVVNCQKARWRILANTDRKILQSVIGGKYGSVYEWSRYPNHDCRVAVGEEAVKRYVYREVAKYIDELTSTITQSPSAVEQYEVTGPGANRIPLVITNFSYVVDIIGTP